MTASEQQKALRDADALLCQAQALVADVCYARDQKGELVTGDAVSTVLGHCNKAIDILRDCGESPDYNAAWERLPGEPGP
jgi:hypothetical protein